LQKKIIGTDTDVCLIRIIGNKKIWTVKYDQINYVELDIMHPYIYSNKFLYIYTKNRQTYSCKIVGVDEKNLFHVFSKKKVKFKIIPFGELKSINYNSP